MLGGICYDSWKLICEYLTIYDEILTLVPSTRLFLEYNILNEKKYIMARRIGNSDPLCKSIEKGFIDGVMYWINSNTNHLLDSMRYAMIRGHLDVVKYSMSKLIEGTYNSNGRSLECYYASNILYSAISNGTIESMQYILSIKDKYPTTMSMFNNGQGKTTPLTFRDWLYVSGFNWLSTGTIITVCIKQMHDLPTFTWIIDNICPSLTKMMPTTLNGYTYVYCEMLLRYHDILKERDIYYNYPILMNSATSCSHEGMKELCKDHPITEEYKPLLNHNDFFDMLLGGYYKICQWMIDNIPNFKNEFCYQLILDSKMDNELLIDLCMLYCDISELIHDNELQDIYNNICIELRMKGHNDIANWIEEHIRL